MAELRHTLVLLRHAKSDWSGSEPDRLRPLGPRGRRQAPEAGRWLAAHLPTIDLAVVSTATRATATWQLVAAELNVEPPVRLEERVYAASATDLLLLVHDLAEELGSVLLVGHNPGLEDLVAALSGDPVPMPTSALAVITVPGAWADVGAGSGELVCHGRPPAGSIR